MTRLCNNLAVLLANTARWQDRAGGFRGRHGQFDWASLGWPLLAVAAVGVALWMFTRYRHGGNGRRSYNSPRELFRSLCRAHDLDRGQRRLLRKLATQLKLPEPAAIFLRPEHLTEAGPKLMPTRVEAITALRQRLFEEPAAEAQQALRIDS